MDEIELLLGMAAVVLVVRLVLVVAEKRGGAPSSRAGRIVREERRGRTDDGAKAGGQRGGDRTERSVLVRGFSGVALLLVVLVMLLLSEVVLLQRVRERWKQRSQSLQPVRSQSRGRALTRRRNGRGGHLLNRLALVTHALAPVLVLVTVLLEYRACNREEENRSYEARHSSFLPAPVEPLTTASCLGSHVVPLEPPPSPIISRYSRCRSAQ